MGRAERAMTSMGIAMVVGKEVSSIMQGHHPQQLPCIRPTVSFSVGVGQAPTGGAAGRNIWSRQDRLKRTFLGRNCPQTQPTQTPKIPPRHTSMNETTPFYQPPQYKGAAQSKKMDRSSKTDPSSELCRPRNPKSRLYF